MRVSHWLVICDRCGETLSEGALAQFGYVQQALITSKNRVLNMSYRRRVVFKW
ncbi:hypothetical protein HMPREF9373_1172 [Psychrobacter sp. 1501(2011)]|nr:hypothetical protein HMPREF9373_1172 [Psychrobacter sp. 1501(2011)]